MFEQCYWNGSAIGNRKREVQRTFITKKNLEREIENLILVANHLFFLEQTECFQTVRWHSAF